MEGAANALQGFEPRHFLPEFRRLFLPVQSLFTTQHYTLNVHWKIFRQSDGTQVLATR